MSYNYASDCAQSPQTGIQHLRTAEIVEHRMSKCCKSNVGPSQLCHLRQ